MKKLALLSIQLSLTAFFVSFSSQAAEKSENELNPQPLITQAVEESDTHSSFIRNFKEGVEDENLTILDILPTEIIWKVLGFFPLDQLPQLQLVSTLFADIISNKFVHAAEKKVPLIDILYFKSLYGNDTPIDWKRLIICHDWVQMGCSLLKKTSLEDKNQGISFLTRAADNGSITSYKKLIRKVIPSLKDQSSLTRQGGENISLIYLHMLKTKLPSLGLSPDEKEYLTAKYCLPLSVDIQSSIKAFSPLAKKGHPKALFKMSKLTNDISYMEKSASTGYYRAQFELALFMEQKGNTQEAKTLLKRAAKHGYAPAQVNLAILMLKEGNTQEAKKLLKRAADQGDAPAQANLASLMWEEGNTQEAKRLLKRAADQGDASAQINLGILMAKEGNLDEARRFFRLPASQGDALAQYNLAIALEEEGDLEEAERIYTLAADQGHAFAQFRLGVLLYDQGKLEEAKRFYALAADQGLAVAQFNLAILMWKEGNTQEAKRLCAQAADQGHVDAQFNLGILLYNEGNVKGAINLWILAAKKGHLSSQRNLASLKVDY